MQRYLFQDRLRRLVIVPESRCGGLLFQFSYLLATNIEVKDTSLVCPAAASTPVSGFLDQQSWLPDTSSWLKINGEYTSFAEIGQTERDEFIDDRRL
jgi:hypothetical protein